MFETFLTLTYSKHIDTSTKKIHKKEKLPFFYLCRDKPGAVLCDDQNSFKPSHGQCDSFAN